LGSENIVFRIVLAVILTFVAAGSAAAQDHDPATPTQIPSVRSLFTQLAGDARHLATGRNLEVIAAGGATALLFKPHEVDVNAFIQASDDAENTLDAGDAIGGGAQQIGGAFAAYILGRTFSNARLAVVGSKLVRAQLLNAGLTQGLKIAVNRRRPDHGPHSFPSGHTSASFATATVIQHEYGWKAGLTAYAVASYVGVSRLSENSHFASDVAFGAAMGIVAARAVTLGHGGAHVRVTPIATPHTRGFELMVSRE
jgi:membrane-associated phospholipid phosphatase